MLRSHIRKHSVSSSQSLRARQGFSGLSRAFTTSATTDVLAIESSCDDSSVAILRISRDDPATSEKGRQSANVFFHKTLTAQSQQYNGIHPLVALTAHHNNVAQLVQQACQHMWTTEKSWRPTIVAATRGPGMRSNLAVGLSLAKGLSVAWSAPFIGVHHMQAHALTPRLCSLLDQAQEQYELHGLQPSFPYLTVLVSGGHTMLLESSSITEHKIIAQTQDIAIGDCLDKAARAILPASVCTPPYGRALERYAFPNGEADYNYTAPRNREEELRPRDTTWGWTLRLPLQDKSGDKTSKRMIFSFAGLLSAVDRIMLKTAQDSTGTSDEVCDDQRRDLAREVLRVSFEHLVSRILLYLTQVKTPPNTIVVSGGVASNRYLRYVLRKMLDARGYSHIHTVFPPVELCTDNALMIAWAAHEMSCAGYTTSLDVEPIRKWSMDSSMDDGGIIGAPGWQRSC